MSLIPESRDRFFPVRETCFKAAIKIKPGSDAYDAAQRVLDIFETDDLGKLADFDGQKFYEDLITIGVVSGLTFQELFNVMKKAV